MTQVYSTFEDMDNGRKRLAANDIVLMQKMKLYQVCERCKRQFVGASNICPICRKAGA